MIKKFYKLGATIIIFVLLSGCVTLSVVQPDGTKYKYTRFGKQSLEGFAFSRDGSKVDMLLDKQDGSSDVAAALKNATEAALRLAK